MSISLKDKNFANIYHGDKTIKAVYSGNNLIYPVQKILYSAGDSEGIWSAVPSSHIRFSSNGISFAFYSGDYYVDAHIGGLKKYKKLCVNFSQIGTVGSNQDRYIYAKVGQSQTLTPVYENVEKKYPYVVNNEYATLILPLTSEKIDGINDWVRIGGYADTAQYGISFFITKIWLE